MGGWSIPIQAKVMIKISPKLSHSPFEMILEMPQQPNLTVCSAGGIIVIISYQNTNKVGCDADIHSRGDRWN